ncbi:MAG TPA: hypothetical protein VER17_06110 [Tepidisphaeraceae bacterium]|nr:hypothetical protein [Tepidisphaeraceae bacterium]
MTDPTAVLSMIHESDQRNSATRLFRGEPVLAWTLRRLERSARLAHMVVICWEDQLADVEPVAAGHGANVLVKGPRAPLPSVEAVAAVRRWSDGWRGDLRGACDFDLGFHSPWVKEAVENLDADAAILIDPAAGLVDPVIIDRLIVRAAEQPAIELVFSHTPPGLGGAVVRMPLLKRLAEAELHPGHLLHASNDQVGMIACDGALPLPAAVHRAHGSFKLDSHRQIWRITNAMVELNGQLIKSESEALVTRLGLETYPDPLPRDIVLELTTERSTRPTFLGHRPSNFSPRQMKTDTALRLFKECSMFDDVRLTLAGSGDALLAENLGDVIEAAVDAGIHSVRVVTDLLDVDAVACAKSLSGAVDILSVHLPAASADSYLRVMGVDAYEKVLKNIERFHGQQDVGDRGTPLLIPLFTPSPHNKDEERAWFERWPYGVSAAHSIAPAASKLMVLADGRIVANNRAQSTLGVVGQTPIAQAWLKDPLQAA